MQTEGERPIWFFVWGVQGVGFRVYKEKERGHVSRFGVGPTLSGQGGSN